MLTKSNCYLWNTFVSFCNIVFNLADFIFHNMKSVHKNPSGGGRVGISYVVRLCRVQNDTDMLCEIFKMYLQLGNKCVQTRFCEICVKDFGGISYISTPQGAPFTIMV